MRKKGQVVYWIRIFRFLSVSCFIVAISSISPPMESPVNREEDAGQYVGQLDYCDFSKTAYFPSTKYTKAEREQLTLAHVYGLMKNTALNELRTEMGEPRVEFELDDDATVAILPHSKIAGELTTLARLSTHPVSL
jgi:hypothetical protein